MTFPINYQIILLIHMKTLDIKEERQFGMLMNRIYNKTNLDTFQFKENYLKRRIKVRMFARKINTYGEYLSLLNHDPSEFEFLLEDLTINVTSFFRDPEVFRLLEEEIFPLMIYNKVRHNKRVIKILSAGCSSGEEPYSLAIIMRELLGEEFNNFRVDIIGVDLDKGCLKAAKDGFYKTQQFENTKEEYLLRYFSNIGGMYKINNDIINMVHFKPLDLFSGSLGSYYDVILCRNVIIYFTKEMQQKLFMKFYSALNKNGCLIIGKTETIMGDMMKKFKAINTRERIYQKIP